ncbi:DoxX family protein [Prevotella sp. KH2C16]|uniref:DoxX family protein n=1 Tax=Prevotella sp. KH2C16 TaxID=1855325 RepID=UPI0008F1D276|nr:DoxX family protein [Prevotella sp. KH2C16]SFG62508.1 putative oxidoreductase [Prevotella sp. KH2C16]
MIVDKDFLRNQDLGLLVLRVSIGGLMLFHGVSKLLHGVGFIEGMLAGLGLPGFIAYGCLLAELVGAAFILVGLWTRAAAFVLTGNMVVAILMAHSSQIFSLDPMTGGLLIEDPLLFLLGAAALCFTGGGRYALTKGNIFS